jgi:hypothetical protein
MAQVLKRRSLVNSGRRRRRSTNGKRRVVRNKMSAKQIKFFGTARQRAALRASSHRKRRSNPKNYGTKFGRHWSHYKPRAGERKASNKRYAKAQDRLGNPRRRRRKARRKNVGAIYSIGLAGLLGGNPGRKRRHTKRRVTKMARRRRARHSNAGTRRRRTTRARRVYVHRHRRRATSNPSSYRRRRRSRVANRHHRRRNPGISGALSGTTGMFKNALSVIGGAVGSRYATQLALGASNTGAIGYLANAIAALALGWAAGKFMKSPQIGAMVTLGGFTGLALRMLSDLTPIGQYVNLSLSGAGKAGDTGIGLITDTTFYVPTVFNSGSMTNAMVPNQLTQLMAAGSVGSKSGVGSYRRRRAA